MGPYRAHLELYKRLPRLPSLCAYRRVSKTYTIKLLAIARSLTVCSRPGARVATRVPHTSGTVSHFDHTRSVPWRLGVLHYTFNTVCVIVFEIGSLLIAVETG